MFRYIYKIKKANVTTILARWFLDTYINLIWYMYENISELFAYICFHTYTFFIQNTEPEITTITFFILIK